MIRKATPADLYAATKLFRELNDECKLIPRGQCPEDFDIIMNAITNKNGLFLLYQIGKKVAGVANAYVVNYGGGVRTVAIDMLYVVPKHRKKGNGVTLCKHVYSWAKSIGVNLIEIHRPEKGYLKVVELKEV